MFEYKNYFKNYNESISDKYVENIETIRNIVKTTESKNDNGKQEYFTYFNKVGKSILMFAELEMELNEEYFETKTFEELLEINHKLYEDVSVDNYNKSYANPTFAVQVFGDGIGQVMSYLYTAIRGYVEFAYQHRVFDMHRYNELFLEFYDYILNTGQIQLDVLKGYVSEDAKANIELRVEMYLKENFDSDMAYIPELIQNSDLNDLRYLFKYGKYIGENEIAISKYLNSLPQETINSMANTFTNGFREGFIRDNKDMSIKSTVSIRYQIGFERMILVALHNFSSMKLKPIIHTVFMNNREFDYKYMKMFYTKNKQFIYDHRFDHALYLDKEYTELKEKAFAKTTKKLEKMLKMYAGPAVLEVFGEKSFEPKSKEKSITLSEEQSGLQTGHQAVFQNDLNKYVPRSEWSFTIISYPIPEIGEDFEEIFYDTIKVNTLESDLYERIQQNIIAALDKGEFVHVKGKGSNKTDIIIRLHELKDPAKETNFHNCIADVNIPVGEVYTSPVLTGTNGKLHVEEVYLRELKYENLEITFKDGYIEDYSCTNFDNEEDNKKYIRENLMFPHKTLPIGEFAIGTNTTAYVMANKYNIVNLLPILIVEKMGPHFAIGDTCFSWSEDVPVYNPMDGKEVVARDNEKSILRKENINEAYTQCHTDITLPYSGLASIATITKNGERIEIINDGRFVLEGTEELNKAFEE